MRPTRLQKSFLEAQDNDFCHANYLKLVNYCPKLSKMCKKLEICDPKWYTKIVTNFKAFCEVEVLFTIHLNFVTRNKIHKVVKSAPKVTQIRHNFVNRAAT